MITREELQSGHCTSGHCTSGQLSLAGFLDLDRWVPWLPIRTVRVHATDTARLRGPGPYPLGWIEMSQSKEHVHLRFQAVVEAAGIASLFLSVTLVAYIVFFYW